MAILVNVKLNEVLEGEITKVEYEGTLYEKIEGDPQVGDLIRVDDNCPGLREGDFFICDGIDADGDAISRRGHLYYREHYQVFREIKEAQIVKPGDKIRIVDASMTLGYYENGDILTVKTINRYDKTDFVIPKEFDVSILFSEFEVIEEENFEIGDKVHLLAEGDRGSLHGFEKGGIYEVSENNFGSTRICILNEKGYEGFADPFQLAKLTDEEAEEFEWSKIGREPGEYKAGDIVRITEVGRFTGEFRELIDRHPLWDNEGKGKAWHTREGGYWLGEKQFELIAPVEQRFDKGGAE